MASPKSIHLASGKAEATRKHGEDRGYPIHLGDKKGNRVLRDVLTGFGRKMSETRTRPHGIETRSPCWSCWTPCGPPMVEKEARGLRAAIEGF